MTDSATPSDKVLDTLIVGAGISGLTLAYSLHKQHDRQILVSESTGRVGGNITTESSGEFLWEEGPNSFQPKPEMLQLIVDVGLEQELILADRRLPRFVYWQGKLHPVPMSPPAAISSQLLSWPGKLRALTGALGFVPPAMGEQLSQQGGEETVAQFFGRHLGAEVTERLVTPFVSGVYAGDVNQLSAAAAFRRVVQLESVGGGLLAGAIMSRKNRKPVMPNPNLPKTKPGELGSFKQGLQALPLAIASQLGDAVKLKWRLTSLHPTQQQTYMARFATAEDVRQIEARTVVITSPAYVAAELLQPLASQASLALRKFYYPPVASVVLAYPISALKYPLRGFGNLIPRSQGIRTLGTIWTSSLFPGRAPQGWQVLTSYIGGATDSEITDLDSEQIAQAVHQDLCKILLKPDAQPKVLAVHLWQRAIPQYTLGHEQRWQQITTNLQQLPGIYLCSNYIDGVALPDCVLRAQGRAADINQYLQSQL